MSFSYYVYYGPALIVEKDPEIHKDISWFDVSEMTDEEFILARREFKDDKYWYIIPNTDKFGMTIDPKEDNKAFLVDMERNLGELDLFEEDYDEILDNLIELFGGPDHCLIDMVLFTDYL